MKIFGIKSINSKLIVEFVISRAVSVLFFKLKATGMLMPVSQSSAANSEGKIMYKIEDRIIPRSLRRSYNVIFFFFLNCSPVSGTLG